MVDEKITASELGAYTNNISNKEGIKKVVKAINDGLSPDLSDYQKKLTAGDNITITEENVISSTTPTLTATVPIKITNNVINLEGWEEITEDKQNYLKTHIGCDKDLIVKCYNKYYIGYGNRDKNTATTYNVMELLKHEDSSDTNMGNRFSYVIVRPSNILEYTFMIEKHASAAQYGSFNRVTCYDALTLTQLDDTNIDEYMDSSTVIKPFILRLGTQTSGTSVIVMPQSSDTIVVTSGSLYNGALSDVVTLSVTTAGILYAVKNNTTINASSYYKINNNSRAFNPTTGDTYTLYSRDTIN